MYLEGRPLSDYGGNLEEGYSVSGVEISCDYTAGRNGGSLILLNQRMGLKTIRLPLVFNGSAPRLVRDAYSLFCQHCIGGKKELLLPDERQYTAVLTGIGQEEWITENDMAVELTFTGYCHGAKRRVAGNTVCCTSTLPETDCVIRAKVSQKSTRYQVGTVIFHDVLAGDILVVDGIHKRILVNNVPAAQQAEWIRFPVLTPGINKVACMDSVTVEYYPVYF